MWVLIKSELQYQKFVFLISPLIITVLFYLQIVEHDLGNIIVVALLFWLGSFWNSHNNKERRVYQLHKIPLSTFQLALSRILTFIILCLPVLIIHKTLAYFFSDQIYGYKMSQEIILALLLTGFSIYFILRDLLLAFFRRIGLTANRMIMIITMAVIGLNILGIFFFIQADSSGADSVPLKTVFSFIKNLVILVNQNTLVVIVLAFVFAGLTMISFPKRQTYLE
jgi:hypothetical protein